MTRIISCNSTEYWTADGELWYLSREVGHGTNSSQSSICVAKLWREHPWCAVSTSSGALLIVFFAYAVLTVQQLFVLCVNSVQQHDHSPNTRASPHRATDEGPATNSAKPRGRFRFLYTVNSVASVVQSIGLSGYAYPGGFGLIGPVDDPRTQLSIAALVTIVASTNIKLFNDWMATQKFRSLLRSTNTRHRYMRTGSRLNRLLDIVSLVPCETHNLDELAKQMRTRIAVVTGVNIVWPVVVISIAAIPGSMIFTSIIPVHELETYWFAIHVFLFGCRALNMRLRTISIVRTKAGPSHMRSTKTVPIATKQASAYTLFKQKKDKRNGLKKLSCVVTIIVLVMYVFGTSNLVFVISGTLRTFEGYFVVIIMECLCGVIIMYVSTCIERRKRRRRQVKVADLMNTALKHGTDSSVLSSIFTWYTRQKDTVKSPKAKRVIGVRVIPQEDVAHMMKINERLIAGNFDSSCVSSCPFDDGAPIFDEGRPALARMQ